MARISAKVTTAAPAELRFTPSGKAVATVNAAENHSRQIDGRWEETGTTWYRLTLFGNAAERFAEELQTKGVRLLVEGRFETREYERRDGGKGVSNEITVDSWGIIPKVRDNRTLFQKAVDARAAEIGVHSAPAGGQPDDPWATTEPAF